MDNWSRVARVAGHEICQSGIATSRPRDPRDLATSRPSRPPTRSTAYPLDRL